MIRKRNVLLILCVLTKAVLYSDDTNEETLNRLLKDAVTISVHSRIVIHDSEDHWESDLKKVTIPGRTVTLIFETENEKLSIELTPFKIDEESYMLTAMSNFWRDAIDGVQFRSSFKSVNLQLEELILFYPLGLKTQEALTGGSLYMELGIKIIPFEREKELSE